VPGGVLIVGGMALRPDLSASFLQLSYLGYYAKMVLIIFTSYVAGLILAMTIIGVIGGIGAFLGVSLGHYLKHRWHDDPWSNKMWREVAQKFIGEELTPVLDRSLAEGEVKALLVQANNIPDFTVRMNEVLRVLGENTRLRVAQYEWAEWYRVLDTYFPPPQPPQPTIASYFSQTAYCTAGAILVLLHFSGYKHSLLYWASYLTLVGCFLEYLFTYFNPLISDQPIARQIGAMMRFLLTKQQSSETRAAK
jgi:hypothetical protein